MSTTNQTKPVEHLDRAERAAVGRAARADVPRRAHATWEPPADRRSPVELLEQQATTRVPELVPLRYGRMLVSPFTFYRGAAYLMASDLAGQPRTSLHTQLCGDAHLSNFGFYAAPDRTLVFDVNDFDETLPGPFEWDLKRLVDELRGRRTRPRLRRPDSAPSSTPRCRAPTARRCTGSPSWARSTSGTRASASTRSWSASRPSAPRSRSQRAREEHRQGAQSKDSLRAFGKLTEIVDGELRIRSDPPRRRPDPRAVRRPSEHDALAGGRARHGPLLPRDADERPPAPARALPLRRRRAQGRRRRQRRHARLDHAAARPRRRRPAVPPVQGGRGVGAGAVPRRRASSTTTASASSRASA